MENDQKKKYEDLKIMYKNALIDRELALALSDKPIIPGVAGQLVKLMRDELEVAEEKGHCQVVSRDGRKVSHAVSDWLSSSEFAHFCQASSQGGAMVRSENPSALPSGGLEKPRTLGDAILQRWRESSTRSSAGGLPGIGLGRRR